MQIIFAKFLCLISLFFPSALLKQPFKIFRKFIYYLHFPSLFTIIFYSYYFYYWSYFMLILKFENIKWCSGNSSTRFFTSKYGKPACYPSPAYKRLKKDFKQQFDSIVAKYKDIKKNNTGSSFMFELEKLKSDECICLSIEFIRKVKNNYPNIIKHYFNSTPDVDNICKTLFDLLKDNNIIKDDRFIVYLDIEKKQEVSETPHQRGYYDIILYFGKNI